MKTNFKYISKAFKLNGFNYSHDDLLEVAYDLVKEGKAYQKEIGNFLFNWLDETDCIKIHTSGSTGVPKDIQVKKQAMVNSALATGEFFNLTPGDAALHCLPTQFIAGKMMLVRAMILGLEIDIVESTAQPVFDYNKKYHFCAMIPMQLENTFKNCNNIQTIIVGGAPVSAQLTAKIQDMSSQVYETFGMTETVSHIALKKLNAMAQPESDITSHFQTLPNITVSQDERNCLVINAPDILENSITTNDVVNVYSEKEFEWIGRLDNVINSGGLKLFPETIEAKLKKVISSRFFVTSIPHETLGKQLVLIVEGEENSINNDVFFDLDKHEKPNDIYYIQKFTDTASGKIQRRKTLELISEL